MGGPKIDYYELLGVERDADEETIRKAFHAAARDCHPDVSDSEDAERRFRELAEAYGVLSKPGPRLLYDRYGYRGRGNSGFDEALWEARERVPRGESIHATIEIRPFEAEAGTRRLVRFQAARPCAACDGRGTAQPPDPDCPSCGGSGLRRRVANLDVARLLHIEACPDCGGATCSVCEGTGLVLEEQQLRVRIPSGVEDCAQLRVAGEGDAVGKGGGIPGDLLVQVHVLPEPRDRRLVRYVALALFLFALGLLIAYLF